MIYCRHENVLMDSFDNQVLLFDLRNNLPYILNDVASYVFMHTDGTSGPEVIAEKVCEKYDVEFNRALLDIELLYEELVQKGLIRRVEEQQWR